MHHIYNHDETQNDAIKEKRTSENVHARYENLTKRTVKKLQLLEIGCFTFRQLLFLAIWYMNWQKAWKPVKPL